MKLITGFESQFFWFERGHLTQLLCVSGYIGLESFIDPEHVDHRAPSGREEC